MKDWSPHFNIATAIVAVSEMIVERGQKPPSRSVQLKAARLIGTLEVSSRPSITYRVPASEEGRYHLVALYVDERVGRAKRLPIHPVILKTIVAAECPCDARRNLSEFPRGGMVADRSTAPAPCAHILTALTLAELDGYHMSGPES